MNLLIFHLYIGYLVKNGLLYKINIIHIFHVLLNTFVFCKFFKFEIKKRKKNYILTTYNATTNLYFKRKFPLNNNYLACKLTFNDKFIRHDNKTFCSFCYEMCLECKEVPTEENILDPDVEKVECACNHNGKFTYLMINMLK